MTADWTDRIGHAALQVEVPWTPARADAILRGVHRRRRRKRQLRALGAMAAVLALAVLSPRLVASLRAPRAGSAASAGATASQPAASLATATALSPGSAAELVPVELAPVRLRDGSVARPRGRTSQVRVREDGPGRTVVALSGAAQFEVVHDPLRLFRVETRGLAVEVLGTKFVVEEQGSQVRVAVQQGRVRVLWASHYDELSAGHSAVFFPEPAGLVSPANPPGPAGPETAPPAVAAPPLVEPAPVSEGPAASGAAAAAPPHPGTGTRRSLPRPPRAAPLSAAVAPSDASAVAQAEPSPPVPPLPPASEPTSWQALAHEGQFEQAYRLAYGPPAEVQGAHRAAPPPLLKEREVVPSELLLLADVARLSHHPADAVAPLSRLLREHATDPRAPLAAFTLGRVLLDELGRPREAAQSFLRVQELDPDGPLSQDALAREVEAWSRAGEAASARARALQYVQKYPAGRRLHSVRHFGELL